MSGYYPGVDRSYRRRGEERRQPYPRRADRSREDIPWRNGGREDDRDRDRYRDRDGDGNRGRDSRYRSRSRDRQSELRYQRFSRESSRERRPSPPASRYRRDGSPLGDRARRSQSRESIYRREEPYRHARDWERERRGDERRGAGSRVASPQRPQADSRRGVTAEPLDYSSEEGMVSPPPRRAAVPPVQPCSPARRDRKSSRSSSTSDRPRLAEKRDRLSAEPSIPHTKQTRMAEGQEEAQGFASQPVPPTGAALDRAQRITQSALPLPSGTNTAGPSQSKPFAPPSAPRSERFGPDRFGAKEPPRAPAAERYGAARAQDGHQRFGQAIPAVVQPQLQIAQPLVDRDTVANASIAQTPGRLEPLPSDSPSDRVPRPITPASSHRSPGTPASGADSSDRRSMQTAPPSKPSVNPYAASDRRPEASNGPAGPSNPYTTTPARGPAPALHPATTVKKPEKTTYDRGWKRYKPPAEPMILDRATLDSVLKEQAIDESKSKFVTVRSREISRYSEWEGELARATYERAKKTHAFQILAHEARLARYDLDRAEDEIVAAENKVEYARSYQAHLMDKENFNDPARWSPRRATAADSSDGA